MSIVQPPNQSESPSSVGPEEIKAMEVIRNSLGELRNISLPIDLTVIVKNAGLIVELGNFKDANISGAYSKADKKIYVANDDPYYRQAFTVAHELGHFYLHKDSKDSEVFLRQYSDPDNARDELEVQANKFAAALLMPRELVEQYWTAGKGTNEIASIFGVSPTAAYFRLKNLRLLELVHE